MMKNRNDSIDVFKGFLIIFVIIGHLLLGTIDENIVRFVIYSFHMPLFMFMSGYMINITKLSTMSLKDIFSKYWDRMIKMWLVAFFVFSIYLLRPFPTLESVLRVVYSPWYHLWYVPTLFFHIIIVRFLFKKTRRVIAYSIMIALYVVWTIVKVKMENIPIPMPRWCDFTFTPYFVLGLYFKNNCDSHAFQRPHWFIPILFFPAILATKLIHIQTLYGIISFMLLAFVVILFIYPSMKNDSLPKSRMLSYIGRNSLDIYLWHMIFIQPFKDYISNTTLYYCITFSIFFIFIISVRLKIMRQ